MSYTYGVRIAILPSATWHSITDAEIRAVLNRADLLISVNSRRTDIETAPVLHIGRPADNEPHIEVIADLYIPTNPIVFHAMMLRPELVAANVLDILFTPEYAKQRRYIGP